MKKPPTIGILALQGDYDAHRARLIELGAKTALVRTAADLAKVDALVMPGGESSTMLKFLERDGFFDHVKKFARQHPVFGTCAGAILLAEDVVGPAQKSLGALPIRIRRNAYGRQIESSIHSAKSTLGKEPLEMVFIRAPKIEKLGKGVEVLAEYDGSPVLVRKGKTLAATFHPELSEDKRVHQYFLDIMQTK